MSVIALAVPPYNLRAWTFDDPWGTYPWEVLPQEPVRVAPRRRRPFPDWPWQSRPPIR